MASPAWYTVCMDEEIYEGSDIDNWEDEQVFQDHEGQEEEPEWMPSTGYDGVGDW